MMPWFVIALGALCFTIHTGKMFTEREMHEGGAGLRHGDVAKIPSSVGEPRNEEERS